MKINDLQQGSLVQFHKSDRVTKLKGATSIGCL